MHSSSCREDFTEVFDGFDTLMDRALTLDAEVLTTAECLAMLEHWEVLHRRFSAVAHPMINHLTAHADEAELGGNSSLPWPTGCTSPAPKPPGASGTPPISGRGAP